MTAVVQAPGLPRTRLDNAIEPLSTLRDPRSPGDEFPSPANSLNAQHGNPASRGGFSSPASASPAPEINAEVASLSNKLISAINHQTHLDDALAATRQELEAAQARVRVLEAENEEHARQITSGNLVKKTEVDHQTTKFMAKLADERKKRTSIERDKEGMEKELENLTTALFEEANQMVAAARKERDASDRRNDQLRHQIRDTEQLVASHQEQLAELKLVMQQMKKAEAMDGASTPISRSTSPTPARGEELRTLAALNRAPASAPIPEVAPGPPTSFPHLLSPVLRTDLACYEDFKALVDLAKRSAPSSRVNSGSYGGVPIPGVHPSANTSSTTPNNIPAPIIITTASPTVATHNVSASGAAGTAANPTPVIPLKETKFYKRALTEDIEPALRLDTAPGLSWLARRTVIGSMSEGTLVVEPMPSSQKMSVFSCALCGENRKGSDFARTHRFRTSENENAQRYPLCAYCLTRVRAACDYLGFLRMVKDGHWRTDSPDAERQAWEESVRLRERMFWARIGGGVVPSSATTPLVSPEMSRNPSAGAEAPKPIVPSSAPPTIQDHGPAAKALRTPRTPKSSREDPLADSIMNRKRPTRRKTMERQQDDSGDDDWETAKKAAIFDSEGPPSNPRTSPSVARVEEKSARSPGGLRDALKPRQRMQRAASYEREREGSPMSGPVSRGSPARQRGANASAEQVGSSSADRSPRNENEHGLHINIPGGFDY